MEKNKEILPAVQEAVKGSANEKLSVLLEEYGKAKEIADRQVLRSQILELKREINRTKQFTTIAGNENIKGKSDLDSISASNLLRVDMAMGKEKRGEFLSKSFLYKRTTDAEGLISEEPTDGKDIKEGDILFVDFGKNQQANRRIGAGHMLPTNINIIKITTNINGKSFDQYGVRDTRDNLTGYYNAAGKYIAIFTGDVITIPTQSEISKLPEVKDKSIFEKSKDVLKQRNEIELNAVEKFIGEIDGLEKIEKGFGISTLLIREAGNNARYQDTLTKAIELGEGYLQKGHEKYSPEEIQVAINRLRKTQELLGNINLGLNIESYKSAIAMYESGAKGYHARNDAQAKSLEVNPEKYAYGKYQFIPSTLRGYSGILDAYGISLSRPMTENEIQRWLNSPDAQEAVMDQYIIDMTTKHILNDSNASKDIATDPTKIAYYLALTHIGGPGAINNQDRVDYFNTPVSTYANVTLNRYRSMIQGV